MINIIKTNTLDSKYILEKIKENYSLKTKHLIIVPDRVELSYEIQIMEYLNISGMTNIEVASFSTLADNVLKEKALSMLNAQTEIMLIRNIIEELKNRVYDKEKQTEAFLFYKNAASHINFANEILSVINLIRANDISIEKLESILNMPLLNESAISLNFKNKMHDILLVYKKYIASIVNNEYLDNISKLDKLCEILKNRDCKYTSVESNYCVYISDYTEFSKVEINIIKEFMRTHSNIYISMPYGIGDNKHVYPNSYIEKFKDMARETGIEQSVKEEYVCDELNETQEIIANKVFSYKPILKRIEAQNIHIFKAKTPDNEIKELALNIKRLIKEKNARYKDITVAVSNLESYYSLLKFYFRQYDIPFFADVKAGLMEESLAKLVFYAVKTVADGYKQEDVFAYLKECEYLFDSKQIQEFENYCIEYGINYSTRFKGEFLFGDNKKEMEKLRDKFLAPLSYIDNKVSTVSEFVKMIQDFLIFIDAEKITEDLAIDQQKYGYQIEAKITKQTYRKIEETLSQMDIILGSCRMPMLRFVDILLTVFSSISIATTPMYIDCVYVGDCEHSRYRNKDYMFVIGANDGLYPTEHIEGGLLSLVDYSNLNRGGLEIYPDIRNLNNNSKLNALMILLKPKKDLIISYPSFDKNGEELKESIIVSNIKSYFNINEILTTEPNNSWSVEDFARYCGSKDNALVSLIELKNLVKAGKLKNEGVVSKVISSLKKIAYEVKGKDLVDKLLTGDYSYERTLRNSENTFKNKSLSVSQFETYFKCPFAYYMKYILALNERKEAGVDPRDSGSIMHKIMELFLKEENWENNHNIKETVLKIINEYINAKENKDNYKYLLTKEYTYEFNNIVETATNALRAIQSRIHTTEFRPTDFEVSFGKEDSKIDAIELDVNGKTIKFKGIIDRIDRCGDEFIIIDYKSKSSMSFTTEDIYYGNRIQLVMYMNTIMQHDKNAIPSGLYYLLINNKLEKKEDAQNKYSCTGFSNEESIDHLDNQIRTSTDAYSSNNFPIAKDKKGVIKNKTNKDSIVKNVEQFKAIGDYVIKLIENAANEIISGYVAISPKAEEITKLCSSCTYCPYKKICHIENNLQYNRVEKKNKQEISSIVLGE